MTNSASGGESVAEFVMLQTLLVRGGGDRAQFDLPLLYIMAPLQCVYSPLSKDHTFNVLSSAALTILHASACKQRTTPV